MNSVTFRHLFICPLDTSAFNGAVGRSLLVLQLSLFGFVMRSFGCMQFQELFFILYLNRAKRQAKQHVISHHNQIVVSRRFTPA